MKKPVLLVWIVIGSLGVRAQDTFSICAVDTLTGEVGSAGASCIGAPQIPQGCKILSDVIPGIGVIHTQAYYLATNQNYAHSLMMLGLAPTQIIDSLVANDAQNNPAIRQYGVIDLSDGTARKGAWTGSNCNDYKNHIIGANYTIQGNILMGQQILDSMESRFLNSEGELACKLMAALQGAKVIGADTRCLDDGVSSLSAFLRVGQADDPASQLYLDLNVPSTPAGIDPIDSLQTLVDIWGGCQVSGSTATDVTSELVVSPNPARQMIHFHFTRETGNPVHLQVFGHPAMSVIHEVTFTGPHYQLSENLAQGIYFYRYTSGDKFGSGKFIIR